MRPLERHCFGWERAAAARVENGEDATRGRPEGHLRGVLQALRVRRLRHGADADSVRQERRPTARASLMASRRVGEGWM